ncbi:MAG: hypothetical protein ACI977_000065 [Candidatus Nanohaloarchaea archaeon]|jgi:hypothetical protein
MNDPWKFLAFPASAASGLAAASVTGESFAKMVGLQPFAGEYAVAAATGLLAGFIIDEMLPTYLQHIRSGGGGMDADMGGDMGDDDFDF